MKTIEVCFSICSNCNFNCEYCYSSKPSICGDHFLKLPQLKIILQNLKLLKNTNFIFYISGGGEPTLNPQIKEIITLICDEFFNKIQKLIIISNGSYKKELYYDLVKIDRRIELKISVHNFINYKTFIYLIKETDINLEFYVMYNPLYKEKYKDLMTYYSRNNLKFTVKKIYNNINKEMNFYNYSIDDINFIEQYNSDKNLNKKNDCEVNKNFIFIHPSGKGNICGFCYKHQMISFLHSRETFLKKIKEIKLKCINLNLKEIL